MLARRSASIQPLKQRQTKSTRSPRGSPSAQEQQMYKASGSNRGPKRSGQGRRGSDDSSVHSDVSALTDPSYARSTKSHDNINAGRKSLKQRGPVHTTIHEDKEASFSKLSQEGDGVSIED